MRSGRFGWELSAKMMGTGPGAQRENPAQRTCVDGPDGSQLSTDSVGYRGRSRLSGFHRAITRFIGSLPFSGRRVVRELVYQCHDARGSAERMDAWKKLRAAMGTYIAAHAVGGAMGAVVAGHFGRQFLQHPSLLTGIATTVAAAFGIANTLVSGAQVDITARLAHGLWQRRDNPPEAEPPPKEREPYDEVRHGFDQTITTYGGLAFLSTYLAYEAENVTRTLGL